MWTVRTFAIAFSWILLILSGIAATESDAAEWIGEFQFDGLSTPIVVHDRSGEPNGASTVDLPMTAPFGQFGLPVTGLAQKGERLRLDLAMERHTLVLDGQRRENSVRGTARRDGVVGTFTLVRLADIDPQRIMEYAGSYEMDAGQVIDLGPMDEFGGRLVYLDQQTRREGPLFPVSQTEFVSGPTMGAPFPFVVRAEFVRDTSGVVMGMQWTTETHPRQFARRIAPHRTEEVVVYNGDVTLRGVLTLPATAGPHPAIVFAPGSGPTQRNVGPWNLFFVRLGFAVLSLDKRGAGTSTGDWRRASLEDLADDWLAGVEMLKHRPDIDTQRIGVHGSSQGGWTASLMAARSRDLAFLIVRAGSGASMLNTMVHEIEWAVRGGGFSEEQAKEAGAAARTVFRAIHEGATWQEYDRVAAPLRQQGWGSRVWVLNFSQTGWGLEWCRLNLDYDAAVSLRSVKIPTLWFLADEDHNVPTAESEVRISAALAEAGNRDVAVIVLRGTGHGFTEIPTGPNADFPWHSRMAAGYWDTMERWLRQRFAPAVP